MEQPIRLETWDSNSVTISGAGRPATKKNDPPNAGKYGFNFKFVKGVAKLATHGEKKDILWLLLLVATIIVNLYIGNLTGSITGQFYDVIVEKNAVEFRQVLWKSAVIVVLGALLESGIKLNLDMISYRWRLSLVKHLHKRYFSRSMFYQILHLDHTIDNPDQRIVQDVDSLTKTLSKVLRVLFEAPLTIVYYAYLTITTITWYSPLLVLGYWLLAFVLNKFLMNPSASAVFRQEQLEGNFRFSHLRLRTYAESIAMYGGSGREQEIVATSFSALMRNRLRLIGWETSVTTATNVFAYFASVINYAIVSLPIFRGWQIPSSAGGVAKYVSNASFRLLMLINGFTQINNMSRDMSDFIGYSNRVAQMLEVMTELENSEFTRHFNEPNSLWLNIQDQDPKEASTVPSSSLSNTGEIAQSQSISFDRFTAFTPDGKTLIKNLSLTVPVGCNLLITGPSGSGKTSILRCLSGLWRSFEGQIQRTNSILFVPQRPYLPFGSLQDQIVYPLATASELLPDPTAAQTRNTAPITADQLWSILKAVELEYLIYRPHVCGIASSETRESIRDYIEDHEADPNDESTHLLNTATQTARLRGVLSNIIDEMESSNLNWTEVLSPGEQQRIGLARILYHKPHFAILDEATSSIDEPMEEKFYAMCKELNITVITVGHKSNLLNFHNRLLNLDRRGNWELRSLKD